MLTVVLLTNISPTSTVLYSDIAESKDIATPHEAWFGYPYNVQKGIKIVGSDAFVHKEGPDLSAAGKLEPRAKKMILVGSRDSTTYRLYDPQADRIVFSCSVSINEKPMISASTQKESPPPPTVEDAPDEEPQFYMEKRAWIGDTAFLVVERARLDPSPEPVR